MEKTHDRGMRQMRSIDRAFTLRSDEESQDLFIEGYFAVFNSP